MLIPASIIYRQLGVESELIRSAGVIAEMIFMPQALYLHDHVTLICGIKSKIFNLPILVDSYALGFVGVSILATA